MLEEKECTEAVNNFNAGENKAKFTIGQALPTYSEKKNEGPTSFITTNASSSPKKEGTSFLTNNNNSNGNNNPVSIFGNGNNNNNTSTTNGNNNQSSFNIFENYDGQQQITSIFNNNNNNNNNNATSTTVKPTEETNKVSSSSGGLFGTAVSDEKKTGNTGLSLFSDLGRQSQQRKADSPTKKETTGTSLFGNLQANTTSFFSNTNTTTNSIFGTLKENSPLKKPISDNEKPATGLFSSLSDPSKMASGSGSLFAGLLDGSKTNKTSAGNIFAGNVSSTFLKNQDKDQQKNNNEENEDEEDENDENEKEEVIDKSKSTGDYKYEELTEEVHGFEVSNFKVNDLQPYGKGKVTIERVKANDSNLVIFRNPAK